MSHPVNVNVKTKIKICHYSTTRGNWVLFFSLMGWKDTQPEGNCGSRAKRKQQMIQKKKKLSPWLYHKHLFLKPLFLQANRVLSVTMYYIQRAHVQYSILGDLQMVGWFNAREQTSAYSWILLLTSPLTIQLGVSAATTQWEGGYFVWELSAWDTMLPHPRVLYRAKDLVIIIASKQGQRVKRAK